MDTNKTSPAYMLFFSGRDWDEGLTREETQRVMDRVTAWFDGLMQEGRVRGGQVLAREGRYVSGDNGRTVADGPFAESKEIVGGYLTVEAEDLVEAVAIAKSCPTLDYGITIEVRPVADECPISKRLREHQEVAAA